MIGRTISHYQITDKLGEGGMGVVYKATDTKLKRAVALKFLAPHLLGDSEEKTRFIREAQAAAALDHPNICTIYEIDEVEGKTFIVMAYVEGQSVNQKIQERPLKLDEALDIAVQTALGLKAAHQKEMVHRDIKPANLMLTKEGQLKVMDFGLAHFAAQSRLTKTGTTLGTVGYMSPEQALGEDTDPRADVWSLGVVIYEMLTGQLPFKGDYEQVVAYSILNEDPEPITALRAGLPMELEWIVGKALAKERGERYQSVEELIVDLRGLSKKLESGKSTSLRVAGSHVDVGARHLAPGDPPSGVTGDPRVEHAAPLLSHLQPFPRKLQIAFAAISVLLVAAVAMSIGLWLRVSEPTRELSLRKFAFTPKQGASQPMISPDGRHIVYRTGGFGRRTLWIQDLDRDEPRQIVGPGPVPHFPFWSPDSDFIAFAAAGDLKKVSIQGGAAITVCQLPDRSLSGSVWSPDGDSIVFSVGTPARLYEVPAQGGIPRLLFDREPSETNLSFRFPHFLPPEAAGRSLILVTGGQIVVRDLETGRQETTTTGNRPVYSPTGHIVYEGSRQSLWALPFSRETLAATGEPFLISEHAFYPSVSRDGTLVYTRAAETGPKQLVWRDRSGAKLGVIGRPQPDLMIPALSPDGSRVVVRALEDNNWDIWVHEVARPLKTRITFNPAVEDRPIWSPKGDKITFSSPRNGNQDLFIKSADGSGVPEELLATPDADYGIDWSRDGKYLVCAGAGIRYLRSKEGEGGYESVRFLNTGFDEHAPVLSRDGRFVAYVSDESGTYEVYVQPFPEGGRRWQVSTQGGLQPRWRGDGKELFYVEGDTLVAVAVTTAATFTAGAAKRLFEGKGAFDGRGHRYDVSADGRRFVLAEPVGAEAPKSSIRVVQNWLAEFRDRQAK